MSKESDSGHEQLSYFAKKLAADPALAARCQAVVDALRLAAEPDIQACIRSEQLGPEDYGIIINARADSIFRK